MMEISPNEVLDEMNIRFPKEFEICVQAVQIRTLQAQIKQEEENEMLIRDRDFDEKIIGTCTDTNQENGIYLVEEGYELESSQSSKTENFPQEGNKIHQDSKSWLNSFVSFRRY